MILSDIDAGRITAHRIGSPLLFGRLWGRLGIGEVLTDLLDGRQFVSVIAGPRPSPLPKDAG